MNKLILGLWLLSLLGATPPPTRDESTSLRGPVGATGATGATGRAGVDGLVSNAYSRTCSAPNMLQGIQSGSAICAPPGTAIASTTRYYWAGVHDFAPKDGFYQWMRAQDRMSRREATQTTRMIANLHLPEGATIANVRCWVSDGDVGSTEDNAIFMAWSVQGTTCNGIAASCGCSNTVTSADSAAIHGVDLTLYTGPVPAPDPACVAPVSTSLVNGPGSYNAHSIEVWTTSESPALIFYGCDVAFNITKALP